MWTKIIVNFLLIFSAYLSVIALYIVFMTIREKHRIAANRSADLEITCENYDIGNRQRAERMQQGQRAVLNK